MAGGTRVIIQEWNMGSCSHRTGLQREEFIDSNLFTIVRGIENLSTETRRSEQLKAVKVQSHNEKFLSACHKVMGLR
jgi:hypothetical protein